MGIISDVNTPHQWYTIPPLWSCKWQCMWSLVLLWFTLFFYKRKLSIFINTVWSFYEKNIFLPQNHICSMQNAKEPITNIPLWQKKEMMRKKWKKICLLAVFIYQPKLLFATDVLDRLKKCNRIYVNAFSLCMECCCILMYLDCILFLLRYICMIIIVVS